MEAVLAVGALGVLAAALAALALHRAGRAGVVAGTPRATARHRAAVARRQRLRAARAQAAAAAFVPRILAPLAGLLARIATAREAQRTARVGRRGEDQVLGALVGALDRRWTAVRNPVLAGAGLGRELDLLLVGPPGVVLLEVKVWPREVALDGEARAAVRKGGFWQARPSPRRQDRDQPAVLQGWLRRRRFAVPAAAALLFPNTTSLTAPAAGAAGEPYLYWGPAVARSLARTLRAAPRARIDPAALLQRSREVATLGTGQPVSPHPSGCSAMWRWSFAVPASPGGSGPSAHVAGHRCYLVNAVLVMVLYCVLFLPSLIANVVCRPSPPAQTTPRAGPGRTVVPVGSQHARLAGGTDQHRVAALQQWRIHAIV